MHNPAMTMNVSPRGQPSAPPLQNFRARWLQTPLTTENVPPLFDWEMYRESRREPSFTSSSTKCGGYTAQGLSSMVNALYDAPSDQISQNYNSSGPTSYYSSSDIRTAVGPPVYMAGGGFGNPEFQQQNGGGIYTLSSQPTTNMHYCARESEDQQYTPWISLAAAIGYTVIFIITMQQNDCPSNPKRTCLLPSLRRFAFETFGENPLLGPSVKTLLRMGALEADLVTKAQEGWRLLSSTWLHAGVFHVSGTVFGLLVLGIPLERQLGFVKVGIIYVLSGFMGSVLSALFLHGRVSVGASGAFMGLLGATLSSIFVKWRTYQKRTQTLAIIAFCIALNAVYGLMPLVDNFQHLGGAVIGFLIGNLFFIRHNFRCWKSSVVYDSDDMPAKTKNAIVYDIAWLLSLGVLIVTTTMGLFALYSGMDIGSGCTWCSYMTCVPSHLWKCTGNRNLGCNPSSVRGGLRVTCADGRYIDWPKVPYLSKITPEIEALCIKACV